MSKITEHDGTLYVFIPPLQKLGVQYSYIGSVIPQSMKPINAIQQSEDSNSQNCQKKRYNENKHMQTCPNSFKKRPYTLIYTPPTHP